MAVSSQSFFRLMGRADPPILTAYPWRRSSRYVVPTADAFGFLSALNSAFSAEGQHWGVNFSDLSGNQRSVELKRINSPPSGELTTARILFFCSSSGAPSAASVGDSAITNAVYCYVCIDANTSSSGPPQLFTAGDPYFTSIYKTLGRQNITGAVAAGSSFWFAENELGIAWNISVGAPGSGSSRCGFAGRFWDDFTGTPGWINGASVLAITASIPVVRSDVYAIMGCQTLSNNNRIVGIKEGSAQLYDLGRIQDGPFASNGINDSGLDGGGLQSIFLGGRVRGSGANFENMGRLHQFKYGPNVFDRYIIQDAGIDQTIVISPSTAARSPSLHLDSLRS